MFLKLIVILMSVQRIVTNNVDTEFPIEFTYHKLNRGLSENIHGSYFGYSLTVNQENNQQNSKIN